jgi:hypothetical protein
MIRKTCKLDTDFQRSISFQRNIEVWIDGVLDTVGKIEAFTDDSVKIDGKLFMRENCKFWIV